MSGHLYGVAGLVKREQSAALQCTAWRIRLIFVYKMLFGSF